GRRAHVALHQLDALDHDAVGLLDHALDLAALTLGLTADHDHLVAYFQPLHHSTSGARLMIFMKRLARSSRATGPKMRVPTGSIWALIKTALLSSNLM